jgi:DNA-binding FrmR family transcriptional regulator
MNQPPRPISTFGKTGSRRGSYQASKQVLLRRFQRIAGQVAGISRMVEDERYCPEVLVQIRSCSAALDQVGYLLLREHLGHCVAEGVRQGEGDAYLDEVMEVIRGYSRR